MLPVAIIFLFVTHGGRFILLSTLYHALSASTSLLANITDVL